MRSAGRIATISIMLAGQMLVAAAFAQSPDDSRIQCKSETSSATRLPTHRICKTRAQWREIERQRDIQRQTDGETLRPEQVLSQPMRSPSANPQ